MEPETCSHFILTLSFTAKPVVEGELPSTVHIAVVGPLPRR